MATKYILTMEVDASIKTEMKWARCKDMEDVESIKALYSNKYPNAKFEVYEVKSKIS